MKKTITKDIIPLLIATILLIISIGVTSFTNYTLNYKHYVGIGLIGISVILYFKNKKVYVYVFGMTLILGILNLIDIFYFNILFGIGSIELNPIFLTLFILFFVFNKEKLNTMFDKKRLVEKENMIKHFELKFELKTKSELKKIADVKSEFIEEAKIASKNILRNKYSK